MSPGKRNRPPPGLPNEELRLPIVAVIFFAALLIRLLYLWTIQDSPFFTSPIIDCYWHHTWAQEIASGDWQGQVAFFRAPLYPCTLGLIYCLFGDGPLAPRIFQHLLGAFTCVFITYLAFKMAGRARTAYIAGSIAAMYGTFVYFEGELLIVTLIIFLDLAALSWLAKIGPAAPPSRYLIPGFLLGLSAIARPTILAFWPPLILWLWLCRERPLQRSLVIRSLSVSLSLFLPVMAVTICNCARSGDFVLIASQGGVNFYIGNNPVADGKTVIAPGTQRAIGEYKDNVWLSSKMTAEEELGRELKPSEVSRYWFRKGAEFWIEAPGKASGLLLRKLYYFFQGYEIPNNMDPYFSSEWSWIVRFLMFSRIVSVPFGLIGPLGLVGIYIWLWQYPLRSSPGGRISLLLLLFGVSYSLSVIIFFVNARFRLPVVPVFIIFSAFALDRLRSRVLTRRISRHARELAILLGLVVLMNVPIRGVTQKLDPAWDYMTTGVSYQLAHKPEKALEWYRKALEAAPDHPQVLGAMGTLYLQTNRPDRATELLGAAVAKDPTQIEAVTNLSSVLIQQGNLEQAVEVCERALEVDPGLYTVSFNLGRAFHQLGRNEEAEAAYRKAVSAQPKNAMYLNHLTVLLIEVDRCHEAAECYQQALEYEPANAQIYFQLGSCMRRIVAPRKAIEAFSRSYELDPEYVNTPLNLAILHEKAGRIDEAVRWYEATLSVQESFVALSNLGVMLIRERNDYGRAVQLFERAVRLAPSNAMAVYNLGVAYRLAGEDGRGRVTIQHALRLDPRIIERLGGDAASLEDRGQRGK